MYRFEKLRVYTDSMLLVKDVYKVIKKLPADEKYALADQLRRSSVSIVLNIAEGTGGRGDIEFKQYLRHSIKSLYETVAGLKVAEMLYGIEVNPILLHCEKVGKEINAFIGKLTANS